MARGNHRKPKVEDWEPPAVDPSQTRAPQNTGDDKSPTGKAVAFDAQHTQSRMRGWDRQSQAEAGRTSPEPEKPKSVIKKLFGK
jgi:hypothetical protein